MKLDELEMKHDEVDTMMIALAVHFSNHANAFSVLHIWSPDTDLFLLFIHFKTCIFTNVYTFG